MDIDPTVLPKSPSPEGKRGIAEVARLAGVAPITVSRVLNNPETVSEATRSVVQAAIAKIGYIPNRVAGNLASSRSKTIGLILPHIGNSTFAEHVRGMTDVLSTHGYNVLVALTNYSHEEELRHVLSFVGQRVAGLSLTGSSHADRARSLLKNAGIPVVEVSSVDLPAMDMLVGFSNESAAYAMVEYLSTCGYRKIGLISAPAAQNDRAAARQAGYRAAVDALGLAQDANLVIEVEAGFASGATAFVQLLSRHPDLEVVICTNDSLAIGCMLEARRRSILVPKDIGIAGFDDTALARAFVPALTTVKVQHYEIGATAARLLLERIENPDAAPRTVDLGFQIVPRESTRAPGSR